MDRNKWNSFVSGICLKEYPPTSNVMPCLSHCVSSSLSYASFPVEFPSEIKVPLGGMGSSAC
jgi:homoserine kinase